MTNSQDYIGTTWRGDVKAVPVADAKKEIHKDHGMISGVNSNNWRYYKKTNTVYWNTAPDVEDKHKVTDFLHKRGISHPTHKNMYTYNENFKLINILKNLICEEFFPDDVPRILYHATFDVLVKRIEKEGIIPGGKRFKNFTGIEKGVYLGTTPEYAGSMVEASENENIPEKWLDEIVIIAIDVSKLNLSLLDRDPNVAPQEDEYDDEIPADEVIYSYIYRGIVPPSAIIDITDYN